MEPHSQARSQKRRESRGNQRDSQEYTLPSTIRVSSTENPYTTLTPTDPTTISGQSSAPSFGGSSSLNILELYQPLGGQDPSISIPLNQASSTQPPASDPQFDHFSRISRPYISRSETSIASHHPPTQIVDGQPWNHSRRLQEHSSTPFAQLGANLEHPDSLAKAQYIPSPHGIAHSNMSIMGPQYFSGLEPTLNRSSNTWPVYDQPPGFPEPGYMDSFHVPPAMTRPQSTTPPRYMSMSLPTQREGHHVRRDNKNRFRRERSHSNSFNPSLSTTPETYPRNLENLSLLQPSSNTAPDRMPLQQYTSPLQVEPTLQSNIYETQYSLGMPEYSNNYLIPYSTAPVNTAVASYPPRPMPASAVSSPDLGTYYRQPPGSNLTSDQIPSIDQPTDPVRMVLSRPKPQCWEHGCNGRTFSTFSNLLRHQREKNGVASKPTCPNCGAEFTRTTARNGHMAHEKCKKI